MYFTVSQPDLDDRESVFSEARSQRADPTDSETTSQSSHSSICPVDSTSQGDPHCTHAGKFSTSQGHPTTHM